MPKYFACLAILAMALFATPAPPKSPPNWFWGCWVATRVLPTGGITGLSAKQEKAILDRRIVFTPTCACSGRTIVPSPKYLVKILSADDFFKLGYFPLNQIGVHKAYVTEVELSLPNTLSDMDFPGNEVYLREHDAVINVENVSFLVERAKAGDPQCGCKAPASR